MILRSYLYAPGDRPDRLAKACATTADAVICDLEDAVAPAVKETARETVAGFACTRPTVEGPVLCVRVNQSAAGVADLEALTAAGARFHTVLVPKCESAELVAAMDRILSHAGAQTRLQPLVESVAGLYALEALSAASSRVRRVSFGAGDFVIDLGARPSPARTETLLARSELVMRSRHLGLEPPVAHVFPALADDEGLARACREDRDLGFGGRACIHPRQLPAVEAAFRPSARELDDARAVLAALEAAASAGAGVARDVRGLFLDEASARAARRTLAQATRL